MIDTKIGFYDGPVVAYGRTMNEASHSAMYHKSIYMLAAKRHGEWCVVDGENEMKYINDPRETGRDANAVYETDGTVVAIETIEPGEEILVDYGDAYIWAKR